MGAKLRFEWMQFQKTYDSTFKSLLNNEKFTDVTLVCEDGGNINAHKVILSSSSQLFKQILINNPEPHIYIHIAEKLEVVSDILKFIYTGEVVKDKNETIKFASILEELGIKINDEKKKTPNEKKKKKTPNEKKKPDEKKLNIDINDEKKKSTDEKKKLDDNNLQNFDKEVNELIITTDKKDAKGKRYLKKCAKCGEEFEAVQIKRHIEKHLEREETTFTCDECGHEVNTRNYLREHKTKVHGKAFKCDMCDKKIIGERKFKKTQNEVSSLQTSECLKKIYMQNMQDRICWKNKMFTMFFLI